MVHHSVVQFPHMQALVRELPVAFSRPLYAYEIPPLAGVAKSGKKHTDKEREIIVEKVRVAPSTFIGIMCVCERERERETEREKRRGGERKERQKEVRSSLPRRRHVHSSGLDAHPPLCVSLSRRTAPQVDVFAVGQTLDVQDTVGKWLPAIVVGVHYNGAEVLFADEYNRRRAEDSAKEAGGAVAVAAAVLANGESAHPRPEADVDVTPSPTPSTSPVSATVNVPGRTVASTHTVNPSPSLAHTQPPLAMSPPPPPHYPSRRGKVYVHFVNWTKKWDEWLDMDGDRILPYVTSPSRHLHVTVTNSSCLITSSFLSLLVPIRS